jgi:L-fucose isomerase-like protein
MLAVKLAMEELMRLNGCAAAATECWSNMTELLGVLPCLAIGELTGAGLPVSCEGDLNGAVTLALLNACALGEGPQFFADLTIRHPQNDNAELLWHCGPFPYALKDPASPAGSFLLEREGFRLRPVRSGAIIS